MFEKGDRVVFAFELPLIIQEDLVDCYGQEVNLQTELDIELKILKNLMNAVPFEVEWHDNNQVKLKYFKDTFHENQLEKVD